MLYSTHSISTGYGVTQVPRFFTAKKIRKGQGCYVLESEEAHHAISVLRLRAGAVVELCDGMGVLVHGVITATNKKQRSVQVNVEEEPLFVEELLPRLILCVACGSLKGSRVDWLVEKATELGAASLLPVLTERSSVFRTGSRESDRLARWKRVSVSAGKQSLRTHFMNIEAPIEFEQLQEFLDSKVCLLATNGGDDLSKIINNRLNNHLKEEIVLIIGPEGDFSETEKETLASLGCIGVSLGCNRLRVETAAIALLSSVHLALHS